MRCGRGLGPVDRRPFPSEISIADQTTEYLWVQLVVEQDPEDDEVVTIRRWFPESGHERSPSREQLEAFGWRYLKATRGTSMMEGAHSPVRTLLAAADLGENEDGLKTLLKEFNDELAGNESVGQLLSRVASHLSRAMPRAVTKDDFAVRSVTDPSSDVLQDVTIFSQPRHGPGFVDRAVGRGPPTHVHDAIRPRRRNGKRTCDRRAGDPPPSDQPAHGGGSPKRRRQPEDHRHSFAVHPASIRASGGDSRRSPRRVSPGQRRKAVESREVAGALVVAAAPGGAYSSNSWS